MRTRSRSFTPMGSQSAGGADFGLVRLDDAGKPTCVYHGAMNKVSPHGVWRCISTSGSKVNECRAACQEKPRMSKQLQMQRYAMLLAIVIVAGVVLGLCLVVAEAITAGRGQ